MNQPHPNNIRVLAIAPSSRGFGFAVLEGPNALDDWGVKVSHRDKNAHALAQVRDLLNHYAPSVIVLEDCGAKDSRRHQRIQKLIREIEGLAKKQHISTELYSRAQVRCAFSANCSATKEEIAEAIAEHFPDELGFRLPPHRQPWMSEDYRMSIFDAVAFALTFFRFRQTDQTTSTNG
jgi:Holliday junction resolvasome RuvABC endonuclease subunit